MDTEPVCDVCGKPFTTDHDGTRFCSNFCAQESDETIAKFKALKPGDFGIWPCRFCGNGVTGKYVLRGACCYCADKRTIEELEAQRANLLKAVETACEYLAGLVDTLSPAEQAKASIVARKVTLLLP